jgi:stearoyl-CoA desaturase (delta-9 desaturase)
MSAKATKSSKTTEKEELGLLAHEKAPRDPPSWSKGNYELNLVACAVLFVPPLLLAGAIYAGVPLESRTLVVTLLCYLLNGFGITLGYHRMYSHRAFTGHWLLQYFMAFAGAGAFQGSIKWWGRNHRIHHRFIDTDKDPYNATRGFWYTHMGWMIMKQDYSILGRVDISDFHCNRIVMAQHKFYFPIALVSGIILPTVICGLGWGDWLGGYFYGGLAKMVFVHHTTFFINSLAHTSFLGAKQNFSENHSSHDSAFCALLTLGEGYHNFHHEFAQDYRNGIKWYHYDPTKWCVRALEWVGLAKNLVRTPNDVIDRNVSSLKYRRYVDRARALEERLKKLDIPAPAMWTWADIEDRVAKGEKLVVIGDYVLDLKKSVPTGSGYTHKSKNFIWYDAHPGGRKILDMYVGKDATDAFSGEIYRHSEGAMNLLPHLRVASLKKKL